MENIERLPEKAFSNGDVYIGSFQGALPHGKGKYTWSDGTAYEGDWEDGKMTGKGQIIWVSGAQYEGDFAGDYLHGFGTFTGSDGSIYRGLWRMNIVHGFGKKQYCNSDIYEGTWKEGVHEGNGRYSWNCGNMYIGCWKGGKMSGRGVMKWANGDLYDGLWLNGLRHGYGIYRFADGGYYFGTWSNGLKDGKGLFYPAGSKHPYLKKWCSSRNSENDEKNLLPEEKPQRSIVKRSLSEKISAGGILKSSSRISHRGVSFRETWSRSDSSREFLCNDSSCALSHAYGGSQNLSQDNDASVYEREYMQGVLIKEKIRSHAEIPRKQKEHKAFHADEVKKSSCYNIFDGHWSQYLRLNLQLGIRYTVGKITPVPVREVRSSDFGERARIRMYFPRKGSQFTPPHDSIDFYWKDYCPMVFRNLREMFKLDAADYMMSICGDDGLRELSSQGKSGSLFFLSHDDRFVIKTLKKSELKVLLRMLPKYYSHVGEHENTLITKFFGLHRIKLRAGRKVRFVVMGNMFFTELRIHRRYDLKGSTQGRTTDQDKVDQNTTLKDLDLAYEFHMDKLLRESLFKQILLDCKFLESQQIIDYSLLVGLHFRAPERFKSLQPPDPANTQENLPSHNVGEHLQGEFQIPPNGLRLVTHEPSSVSTAPGPHIRGKTLKAYSIGDMEVDVLLPGTARLRVQLGVNMPAQAQHKLPANAQQDSAEVELFEVYDVVLYMGIIDILQEYNVKKKLEHAYKSMKFDPLSISVCEPHMYAKRFSEFLEKVFPVVP
ncbi:phosphatidylinositol 4-phosphate 5-kinase 8 isoform X1 [Cannabis sativa]|uniref:Phosphatidylinositol 4-phosphate 5-kinase n=2 Tax=Cannabis sativa TaxID=3483 RepID=A0AB40E5Q6_CANSA|nr:phosphatidylinositol 4-phosphate 5-kinase 8 isoform X1 [Cannabis sativa]XP_030510250.1 phosphatidylinositol 4-phosphate 5-kinase 8 isoform X1 [Cannabis sativa]KAF4362174.1 hypothetical protein G4B88_002313 [Cannabis sativa]KAF4376190.1 hypothetical protein F8388_018859 [Cannabis sativa]